MSGSTVGSRTPLSKGCPLFQKSENFSYDRISIKFHIYLQHERLQQIVVSNCLLSWSIYKTLNGRTLSIEWPNGYCVGLLADGPGFEPQPRQNTNNKNIHSIAGTSVTCMKSLAVSELPEV